MLSDLKKEVLDKIMNTEDENLLQLLKADIDYFDKHENTDITDGLTSDEIEELTTLANEPDEQDTHTLKQFNKATQRWRMK